MKIGDLARRVGVPVDTVRHYERDGLLPPPVRRASGYREYGEPDVARLVFVLRAKRLGFSLVEIRELLELADAEADPTGRLTTAAAAKLAQIEDRIGQLVRIRDALRQVLDARGEPDALAGHPLRSALLGSTGNR